jgi:hypothetical protein
MEVLGRDAAKGAYRVAIEYGGRRVVGLLPEAVMACGALTGGQGHATAYDWIARHEREIETTLKTMANGTGRPRAPFDSMVLAEE